MTDESRSAGPVSDGTSSSSQVAGEEAPSSPPAEEALDKDVSALLSKAEEERDEYLELAKRTKADFENYRKRVAADVQAAAVRGKAEVAREVIDAVDNLERALEAAGEGESLVSGVEMVLDGLRGTLQRHGIDAVDPQGEKFDPKHHEALSTQPVEGTESGVVVEVLQKGYTLGEHLIRPARVVVSA
jgi:molecular chaperone GrpE